MSIPTEIPMPHRAMPHVNRLSGAHILVFGGSSGIGFAIASTALSNGATVVISGSQKAKIDAKVRLLQSLYPAMSPDNVSGHAIDLFDSEKLEANLKSMLEQVTLNGSKRLDHIAFTAGDHHSLPKLSNITLEEAMLGSKIRLIAPLFIAKLISTGTICLCPPTHHLPSREGLVPRNLCLDGSCQRYGERLPKGCHVRLRLISHRSV
jgi:nucleoside-diphosphate-sugar epimerase